MSSPNETPVELIARAFHIATRAVITDIESYCVQYANGWWDTRPMLDPREHAPEAIDMAREAIDYAISAHIAVRHPMQPHLVRITTRTE